MFGLQMTALKRIIQNRFDLAYRVYLKHQNSILEIEEFEKADDGSRTLLLLVF